MQLVHRATTALGVGKPNPRQALIMETLRAFAQYASQGQNLVQMGAKIQQWMQSQNISEQELDAAIELFQNPQSKVQLRNQLRDAKVLTNVVHSPAQPLAMPSFEAVAMPSIQAPAQPQATQLVQPTEQALGFHDGILKDLSGTGKSVLISASTGCGKTTMLRAVCLLKHRQNPNTQFIYIDLQAEPFLGLEMDPRSAMYCSGEPATVFNHVSSLFRQVYSELGSRITAQQRAVKMGQKTPTYHPLWVVFNEWSGFWQQSLTCGVSKKELDELLTIVTAIVTRGRTPNVGCIFTAQLHRKDDIGLPPGVVKNMSLLSLGRMASDSPDGDFSSIEAAISDQYIVPRTQAKALIPLLRQGISMAKERGCALAFSTQGECKLGFIPTEVVQLASQKLQNYRHYSSAVPQSRTIR